MHCVVCMWVTAASFWKRFGSAFSKLHGKCPDVILIERTGSYWTCVRTRIIFIFCPCPCCMVNVKSHHRIACFWVVIQDITWKDHKNGSRIVENCEVWWVLLAVFKIQLLLKCNYYLAPRFFSFLFHLYSSTYKYNNIID